MTTVSKAISVLEKLKVPSGIGADEATTTRRSVEKVYANAQAIEVVDVASLQAAEAFSGACTGHMKRVQDTFKPIVEKAKEAKRAAADAYKEIDNFIELLIEPVREARTIADEKARTFRAAEQRRISIEAEAKRAAEAADAKTKRDAEIKALKESGAKDAAKRLKDEPLEVAAVTVEKLPESKSASYQPAWTCEEVAGGLWMLVKAAAAEPEKYLSYLMPHQVNLNAKARDDKERFSVPGFRAFDKGKTVHR